MRAAPIGAYFADDPKRAAEEARRSARVTHAHPEGVAGAVAVAVAACFAVRAGEDEVDLLGEVIPFLPDSEVRLRCEQARQMDGLTSEQVAEILGSGQGVTAMDTVPFCLWCATHEGLYFEEAMWHTVAGLGDRDTTCAIVGGIVGASRWRGGHSHRVAPKARESGGVLSSRKKENRPSANVVATDTLAGLAPSSNL